MTDRSVILVAPVYNEEDVVGPFLASLTALHERVRIAGLVLVDDGSTDGTVTRIRQCAAGVRFPVRLVRLSRNFGQQNACVAGLHVAQRWSTDLGAEWIGLIDSDLQDDPADVIQLIGHAPDHDVVYAVRGDRRDGLAMRVLAPLFYALLARSASFPIPRNAGTFSIMRRAVVAEVCAAADNDPYLPGLRSWVGFRQKGVELSRRARRHGRSRVGYLGLLRLSLRAFVLYSNAALDLIFYLGVSLMSLAVLATALAIAAPFVMSVRSLGTAVVVVLQLFTLGVLTLLLGLISHLVSRVRDNTSKQRAWIIMSEETLG